MNDIQKCYELLLRIDERLDSTEELLKVISVNELLDELVPEFKRDINRNVLGTTVQSLLEEKGLTIQKCEQFSDKLAIYLKMDETLQVNLLVDINEELYLYEPDVIPVYIFERLYGLQRKRLQEEKISYMVQGKELHIYRN